MRSEITPAPTLKRCSKCGQWKALDEFFRDKSSKDGRRPRCKACEREGDRKRKQTPEYKERERKRKQTPEYKEYMREYQQTPEYKERERERMRKRQQDPKYKERQREYDRKRRQNDPGYRLLDNMRSGFYGWLNGTKKTCSVMDLIGCTLEELWQHMEAHPNWIPGVMTRDNYGSVWQVDHVVPVSWFDPQNKAHMKAAWHYSNLQPMLAEHNTAKGARYSGPYQPGPYWSFDEEVA